MASPNLPAGTHRHTGAVTKLLITFKSETALDAKDAPDQFASWLLTQPKLKLSTKHRYLSHAATLLGFEIVIPIAAPNPIKPVLLNRDTYMATVEKLGVNKFSSREAVTTKKVAKCLFVCTAITGYSLADLVTVTHTEVKQTSDNEWACELTISPARRNQPISPITSYYSGLEKFEAEQLNTLIHLVKVNTEYPDFYGKLQKKAFKCIVTANPIKEYTLRELRSVYPNVLGYRA